jgi:ligand-binding sensor domain-containing protein
MHLVTLKSPGDKFLHLRSRISAMLKVVLQILIVSLVVVQTSQAATPYQPTYADPVTESWRWQSFAELEGAGLRCAASDSQGAMWFGTDAGVRRYDGLTWGDFTADDGLPPGRINALTTSSNGEIYAASDFGISRYSDSRWISVIQAKEDFAWYVNGLAAAGDGSVWAATEWGALRLDESRATLYTTEDRAKVVEIAGYGIASDIVPDGVAPTRKWSDGIGVGVLLSSGLIWSVSEGSPADAAGLHVGDRIVEVDGQSLTSPKQLSGVAGNQIRLRVIKRGESNTSTVELARSAIPGVRKEFGIYDVHVSGDTVWLGLWDGELVRLDSNGSWHLFSGVDGLTLGSRPRLGGDVDGRIWSVTTDGNRMSRFHEGSWTAVSLAEYGGTNRNWSVLSSRHGTLWVGGARGSLHAFNGGVWKSYRSPDIPLPEVKVSQILESLDGALWLICPGQAAVRFDPGASQWETLAGLSLEAEAEGGVQWFLGQDETAVRFDGTTWVQFGEKEGLMDAPVRLVMTLASGLWAVGSHKGETATARFVDDRWIRKTHPKLSWSVDSRAVFEDLKGNIWLGAAGGQNEGDHLGGVIRFEPATEQWRHYAPPRAPRSVYGIGQTGDGIIWLGGGGGLWRQDAQGWNVVSDPEVFANAPVDAVFGSPSGELWVGSRAYGLFSYNGDMWRRQTTSDGRSWGRVRDVSHTVDGSVWAVTSEGIHRFDGIGWVREALPTALVQNAFYARLLQLREGTIWVNSYARDGITATRYLPDISSPETTVTTSVDEVSQQGNTTLTWKGIDRWKGSQSILHFSWRIDGGPWSAFSLSNTETFTALGSGAHSFEVKARDFDFNEDPTPAVVRFSVLFPCGKGPGLLEWWRPLCW